LKLSLSSFVYFNFPLAEAIRRTAAAGYDGIDIWGGRPHAYAGDLTERDLSDLRALLRTEGLEIASFIPAQFRYPTSLCSPNDTVHQESIRYIQASVETAAALGAPVVSVCPGHTLYGQTVEDGLHRLSESLWHITEFASRHGIRVAIEPADPYETDLLQDCAQTLAFTKRLAFDGLGVLLDTGHEHVVGASACEAIQLLGDKLYHIHIDDNHGQRDQHLVPGEGSFDFRSFLQALRAVGYEGFLGAELSWDYTIDPDPAVQRTAEKMRELLSES
jgi:protein FrlC